MDQLHGPQGQLTLTLWFIVYGGRLEVFYMLREQRVEDGELIRNRLEHF